MSKRILHVIQSAYRATLEEQDDTVVWFVHAMKGGGADVAVLLQANAVNYAVEGQDASGLAFGGRRQTQPPRLDADLAKLAAKGVDVWYVAEDARDRGLSPEALVPGVRPVGRRELPALLAQHPLVFTW